MLIKKHSGIVFFHTLNLFLSGRFYEFMCDFTHIGVLNDQLVYVMLWYSTMPGKTRKNETLISSLRNEC